MKSFICSKNSVEPVMANFMCNGEVKHSATYAWRNERDRWIFHSTAKALWSLDSTYNIVRIFANPFTSCSYSIFYCLQTIIPWTIFVRSIKNICINNFPGGKSACIMFYNKTLVCKPCKIIDIVLNVSYCFWFWRWNRK